MFGGNDGFFPGKLGKGISASAEAGPYRDPPAFRAGTEGEISRSVTHPN